MSPPLDTTASFVSARGVSVSIDGFQLLSPTSFTLGQGGVLAVVGPNGSGKSTLLRVLCGRLAASAGEVSIGGAPPDDRDPAYRARLAGLVGTPPLAPNLTVLEHLALVATSWGMSASAARPAAAKGLAEFGIQHLGSRFPHELSTGQHQLFCLALTVVRPFDVLVLDEPEQRLDTDRQQVLADVLRSRVDSGATIVMASHSDRLVGQVATQNLELTEHHDDDDI